MFPVPGGHFHPLGDQRDLLCLEVSDPLMPGKAGRTGIQLEASAAESLLRLLKARILCWFLKFSYINFFKGIIPQITLLWSVSIYDLV